MAGDDSAFATGAQAWIDGLGSVRATIRQTLVAGQLAAHLPSSEGPLRVLDAGCGQGTQALILARSGHEVLGIDNSEQMLAEARAAARAEPEAVQARIRFERADLMAFPSTTQERYDVVCCHGVAMYLPSLADLIAALLDVTRPGGLISLLTRNRAGIAMRAGMTQQWSEALAGFDATHYTNRLGIADARADDPAEVRERFREAGAEPLAWYGVRLFTDHWNSDAPASDLATLIAVEQEAGRRDPYRALAALTHTLASRQSARRLAPSSASNR